MTPNRLLLGRTAHEDQPVYVTPEYQVSELDAWMWALGELPLARAFDAPELQIVLDSDRERWFIQENRPNHVPEFPLGDPLRSHPDLMKMIGDTAREARRAGIGIQAVHYALEYAYLWADGWAAGKDGD